MLKFTAILVFMLIGSLLAGGRSCNSCGLECAPACGTRHFRSCCFNYLRKKRGQDMLFLLNDEQDTQTADAPYFLTDVTPVQTRVPYYHGHYTPA